MNMGESSATIQVPFGEETIEPSGRNCTSGTGNRQYTSAQAKERNRQAFQRRIAQKTSRIHVAERETSQVMFFELELIQTQMAQKPMLRAEVGMRVRCANKASAE